MESSQHPEVVFEHDDFDFVSLEEEMQVDQRCQELLKHFYLHLQATGLTPEQASELAFAADYYLRDYVLDYCRQNVVRPQQGLVRRFAATWFITRTLDPEMPLLVRHLDAIKRLYRYMHSLHLISADEVQFVEAEADDEEYYRKRLESFESITGDGYVAWEAEQPLKV